MTTTTADNYGVTINPINYDLVNDRVELLIGGLRCKWIAGSDYRELRRLAFSWTSGLRLVRTYNYSRNQVTLLFKRSNVVRHIAYEGNAECSLILDIIA